METTGIRSSSNGTLFADTLDISPVSVAYDRPVVPNLPSPQRKNFGEGLFSVRIRAVSGMLERPIHVTDAEPKTKAETLRTAVIVWDAMKITVNRPISRYGIGLKSWTLSSPTPTSSWVARVTRRPSW